MVNITYLRLTAAIMIIEQEHEFIDILESFLLFIDMILLICMTHFT